MGAVRYLPLTFDKSWVHSVVECRGEWVTPSTWLRFVATLGAANAVDVDRANALLVSVEYESKLLRESGRKHGA